MAKGNGFPLRAWAEASPVLVCWLGPREGTNLAKSGTRTAMESQCYTVCWQTGLPPAPHLVRSPHAAIICCHGWLWQVLVGWPQNAGSSGSWWPRDVDARWNMPWRFSRVTWRVEQEKAKLLLCWQSGFWLQNRTPWGLGGVVGGSGEGRRVRPDRVWKWAAGNQFWFSYPILCDLPGGRLLPEIEA